ncbi:diphosphate--fructose-6-phosphate 1-phosphotransferase [Limnoglobus roseus]|uniref:Pyrophosphate--fructose 6-phosphate 1-phosphotransferase n=1 Tax=Limnoglobus roseus TaxID=2598579 RepID=A0A5C1A6X8_9BACT|nr:diphosphate--fructose-6-phosphate 1-phosphotransferase [Limnoglobus roseus]QEL14013.1 6-phosphofructokinase [Limnoglobus roseus]
MSNTTSRGRLAIVVGGGPAPGINGVISSVTIEAINQGLDVYGVRDGFSDLINGDTSRVKPLSIGEVAQFYTRGGSMLGTARTNPAKKDADMANVLASFEKMGVGYLVTVGGDDTAFSGSQVYKRAGGKIKCAHVPKTIDNDLPLPPGIPTFGFETARHIGVGLARSLHEDAKTTGRWYIIISMGRAAGHLALGIGKASASAITIISEEFGTKKKITLDHVCDLVIGAMIKRRAQGKKYGLAILSEGLLENIGEDGLKTALGDDLNRYGEVERDDHGHLRLGEIEFGRLVKNRVGKRLKDLGLKVTIIDKDMGYELRCADPIPFDAEYTRNLGYGAVKFLMSKDSAEYGAIVSFVGGKMVPLKFDDMIDPATSRMRARLVDVDSENYECARRYMIRLEATDFSDPAKLKKLADTVKLTPDQFREKFEYLVK